MWLSGFQGDPLGGLPVSSEYWLTDASLLDSGMCMGNLQTEGFLLE